jgi:hypothetical protein
MLDKIKSFFGVAVNAANLPDPAPIKVRGRQQLSVPSYLTSANASSRSVLPRDDRRLLNTDITGYRQTSRDSRDAVRNFVAASPDLSSAVFNYLRLAISRRYTAVARNMDGTINPDATATLQQIITRFNYLGAYDQGFSTSATLRSVSEQLGKELLLYGACGVEVVLDKALTPAKLQPISVTQIEFYPDGKGVRPVQRLGQDEINLDVPTFIYASLDQDLLNPYAVSPLEPALQPTLFGQEFMNDIRRIVKRVLHPRLKVTIDEAKFRANLPSEIQHDPDKLNSYMAGFVADIENRVNNLAPEDALIYFDTIGIEYESRGNESLSTEYEVLQALIDGKMATGAKAMPAILGHGTQSSNIASTETMLQLQSVYGAVQSKLNEVYSRAFTVALRVLGVDCYVEFEYEAISLRPDGELESFKQTQQARVLELLSLGLITDEEASIQLTGHLPPAGYKPLSGTMFKSAQGIADANPNGESNNGSTLNQNLNSDMPAQGRGQNRKANPVKAEVDNVAYLV